jgi:hypothetical protein
MTTSRFAGFRAGATSGPRRLGLRPEKCTSAADLTMPSRLGFAVHWLMIRVSLRGLPLRQWRITASTDGDGCAAFFSTDVAGWPHRAVDLMWLRRGNRRNEDVASRETRLDRGVAVEFSREWLQIFQLDKNCVSFFVAFEPLWEPRHVNGVGTWPVAEARCALVQRRSSRRG